jgi:hypothetical protein
LALRTDTLFTPALKGPEFLSIYSATKQLKVQPQIMVKAPVRVSNHSNLG